MYVRMHTGGGGFVPLFGVIVGKPDLRAESLISKREVFRWQDGVYGYAD